MLSRDLVVTIGVSMASAAWFTDHVALCFGLLRVGPWWKSVLGFLIAPLAPIFGVRARLWARSALWIVFAGTYVLVRWRASA
jgi:hypothetical protein